MTQTATKRTAYWGNWGITFSTHEIDEHGRQSYAPLAIHGSVNFPVGTRGPCDLPRRDEYRRMVLDWCERGTLPAELTA